MEGKHSDDSTCNHKTWPARTDCSHFHLIYTAHNITQSIEIPKGIVTEIAKILQTSSEIVANDDNVVVKMLRNNESAIQIIVAEQNSKNRPAAIIAQASFRGSKLSMKVNAKHRWAQNKNNLEAFLTSACQHLMCRRQFFQNFPHVFSHSIDSSSLFENMTCECSDSLKQEPVSKNQQTCTTFDIGLRYYKSFFHFNAKLINAALKTHAVNNYTLDMARGTVLNAAIAACSEPQSKQKTQLLFHSDTMSWIDDSSTLVKDLQPSVCAIVNGTHRPNMQLSCRTSQGVVKFPVFVLPKNVKAWAIVVGTGSTFIVMGKIQNAVMHSRASISSAVSDPFQETIVKLRASHVNINRTYAHSASDVVAPRQTWRAHVHSVIANSSCTEEQKLNLLVICSGNNPFLHAMCLLG